MYFDKNLNEFKLGNSRIPKTNSGISKVNSRIPKAKISPHPGPADVKQKSRIPKQNSRIP